MAEVVSSANYIQKRLNTIITGKHVTLHEIVPRELPVVANVPKFGNLVQNHIPRKCRAGKLDLYFREGKSVLFHPSTAYHIFYPKTQNIKLLRDVEVDEKATHDIFQLEAAVTIQFALDNS